MANESAITLNNICSSHNNVFNVDMILEDDKVKQALEIITSTCQGMPIDTNSAIEYLVKIGTSALTNENLKPLFKANVLPSMSHVCKGNKKNIESTSVFDGNDCERSIDNTLVLSMMVDVIKKTFPEFVMYNHRGLDDVFIRKDGRIEVMKDITGRYHGVMFSYSIATKDLDLESMLIDKTLNAVKLLKRTHNNTYIGHIYLNTSQCCNPNRDSFHVETLKDDRIMIIWMSTKDIFTRPEITQEYIVNALEALVTIGKGLTQRYQLP